MFDDAEAPPGWLLKPEYFRAARWKSALSFQTRTARTLPKTL